VWRGKSALSLCQLGKVGLHSCGYDFAAKKMLFFPLIASVVLFLFAWRMEVLTRPSLAGACVLAGVVLQFLTPAYSSARFAMAAVNIIFALHFAIRIKLSM
jgi:hypothetical protein